MAPSTWSLSSPWFSRGSVWTRSHTHCSGLATPTPHLPVLPRHGMGAPQCILRRSPGGCVSMLSYGLSLSVTWYPTCRVPPPEWPMPVCSPCHPGWLVHLWQSCVGVGAGSAAVPCAIFQRYGILARRRLLESWLFREKKEGERRKIPILDTVESTAVILFK